MPQSTTKKSAQATSGSPSTRAGALRSVARSHRRGVPGHACSASVTGAPSYRNGAATIVRSRCWTMWTENEVLTAASRGPVRAMTSTPRPAKKARRARGRGTRPRVRLTRASATRYPRPAATTPSATGSPAMTTIPAFDGHGLSGPVGHLRQWMSPIGVRVERKSDLEGRSDVDTAHHVDRAEVSLDDRSNDRQAQSEPAGVPAAAGVRPSEPVEDAIEVFIQDPRPRVAEGDDRRAVASTDGDLDRVLLARMLHRVLDQRIERHGQPVAVGQDDRLLGGAEHPPTGRRRPPPERVDDDLRHVYRDQVELLRVLGPRKQEQTVDEASQARQLVRDHVHILDDRRIRGA